MIARLEVLADNLRALAAHLLIFHVVLEALDHLSVTLRNAFTKLGNVPLACCLHQRLHADVHGGKRALDDLNALAVRAQVTEMSAQTEVQTLGLRLVAEPVDRVPAVPCKGGIRNGCFCMNARHQSDLVLATPVVDFAEIGLQTLDDNTRLAFLPVVTEEFISAKMVDLGLLLFAEFLNVRLAFAADFGVQAVVLDLVPRDFLHLVFAILLEVITVPLVPETLEGSALTKFKAPAIFADLSPAPGEEYLVEAHVSQIVLHAVEERISALAAGGPPVLQKASLLLAGLCKLGQTLASWNALEVVLACGEDVAIKLDVLRLVPQARENFLFAPPRQLVPPPRRLQTRLELFAAFVWTMSCDVRGASRSQASNGEGHVPVARCVHKEAVEVDHARGRQWSFLPLSCGTLLFAQAHGFGTGTGLHVRAKAVECCLARPLGVDVFSGISNSESQSASDQSPWSCRAPQHGLTPAADSVGN
mmetsp:Transcript_80957/g.188074  ORF Transcript_80957/g.188074 Transcript_80957/m.188074 type:complete len:475 (-) Transcript_80957:30-1454(-)